MKNIFRVIILASLLGAPAQAGWFTIGPMFHLNFDGQMRRPSIALEGAYWFQQRFWDWQNYPVGIDVGIEWEQGGAIRIYSEGQTGAIFYGAALGPVIQFGKPGFGIGLQSSLWANNGFGINARNRFGYPRGIEYAPGLYAKVPLTPIGSDFVQRLMREAQE